MGVWRTLGCRTITAVLCSPVCQFCFIRDQFDGLLNITRQILTLAIDDAIVTGGRISD